MSRNRKRISGIYSITNKINGKRYIGLSINIYKRWADHRGYLRQNSHVNPHLQNAWNKYGEKNFKFEILERCHEHLLEERELYWIDKYDSCKKGYNILYGAGDYSNLKYCNNNSNNNKNSNKQCKPFYVFNRYTREFLGEFNNVDLVSQIYGITYQAIMNCLAQRAAYTSVFELIYKEDYEANNGRLFSEINRPEHHKGFYIVDLMTGEYKHFYHIEHGASYFGIPNSNQISVRLGGFGDYPVWDEYCILDYTDFQSYGSVQEILDKYARVSYVSDCELENNLYSSL